MRSLDRATVLRVALLSLESWDDTWRRNQHLSATLVRSGAVAEVVFVEPATSSPGPDRRPLRGVRVHTPCRRLPMRLGGAQEVARRLLAGVLRDVDVVWVNDPVVGVHCVSQAAALYDVTDDWRSAPAERRIVRRLVAAEDRLANLATTVVCSEVLRDRWRERYGVEAYLVKNGVDHAAHQAAVRRRLAGTGPHIGYVGTLHHQRLDEDLLVSLATDPRIGTLHLVGPDCLAPQVRARLAALPHLVIHGPVPSSEVPDWMASLDVLISPHLVTPFTLSLDAIKAYEYLASGRPVVATPTSGFQHLADRVRLAGRDTFGDEVSAAASQRVEHVGPSPGSWDDRANEMAAILAELVR